MANKPGMTQIIRAKNSWFQAVFRISQLVTFHSYTIFLFTYSDFKTIVAPSTIFGVINSLATGAYALDHDDVPIDLSLLACRLFRTLLWVSLVFIPFAINNQRSPSAIAEDSINKPWRPLPQKRLSPYQAQCIMYFFAALVQIHGYVHKGVGYRQSSVLLGLDIWYNNYGGADKSPVIRNLINAFGYLCFISGALEVALGQRLAFSLSSVFQAGPENYLSQWLLIIWGIIFTTVHLQDLYDQEGDAARGRRTMPLVVGDGAARWTITVCMLIWGVVCPLFWGLRDAILAFSISLACIVALRVLVVRHEEADRMTFRIWNCWISAVYVMPVVAQMEF
ncbi:hypothetical protein BDV26DRAFT_291817 [Aspergillus bertholletiae]|uniref:UbiA prenyltransferase family-domain-containing protein n=1 Tax=Aspergillus bertholletiae TaxID=1226010 RepID=A0A5N7BAZ0_9EURO|nr:hypothetical protein BDV26DRAFT_291817 [Aspergillus bertholletiae]